MNPLVRFALLCLGFAALMAAAALFLDAAEPHGALPMLLVLVGVIAVGWVWAHFMLRAEKDLDR